MSAETTIRSGTARAYTIPTDAREAEGTMTWSSTTLVVVELHAANIHRYRLYICPQKLLRSLHMNLSESTAKTKTPSTSTSTSPPCAALSATTVQKASEPRLFPQTISRSGTLRRSSSTNLLPHCPEQFVKLHLFTALAASPPTRTPSFASNCPAGYPKASLAAQ